MRISESWIVTGGIGFLGRAIANAARDVHIPVATVDRRDGASSVLELHEPAFADLVADIRPALIVHAAGPAAVRESFATPMRDFEGSVLPWLRVLDVARSQPVPPRLVLLSSAAIYGAPEQLPVREDTATKPISPYGHHKLICEQLALEYAALFGLSVLVCRLFSVYGPEQRRLLLWELTQQALADQAVVRLLGTGDERRDYLHVEDAARAICQAALAEWSGLRVVNVASGNSVSVRTLATIVLRTLAVDKPIVSGNRGLMGDPSAWEADVRRLHELVPFKPRPLEQGILQCVTCWAKELARVKG